MCRAVPLLKKIPVAALPQPSKTRPRRLTISPAAALICTRFASLAAQVPSIFNRPASPALSLVMLMARVIVSVP